MNYKEFNDYELLYGVKEKDDESLNIIFKKYEGLLSKVCSKYYKLYKYIGISYDDLIQEGRVGLYNAIKGYSDDESLFYSFALLCIERKVKIFCRNYNSMKNYPLNFSVSEDTHAYGTVAMDKRTDDILIENEQFFECKNLLDFNKGIVFELKYNGFKYKEISKLLDLPISTVDGRVSQIKKILKNNLNIYF